MCVWVLVAAEIVSNFVHRLTRTGEEQMFGTISQLGREVVVGGKGREGMCVP